MGGVLGGVLGGVVGGVLGAVVGGVVGSVLDGAAAVVLSGPGAAVANGADRRPLPSSNWISRISSASMGRFFESGPYGCSQNSGKRQLMSAV